MELINMIEATAAVACDRRLPARVRLAAADEVLLFAGPAMVRQSLSRHIGYFAGCFHGPDGECQCDAWRTLAELWRASRQVWPDAMDWSP